MIAGLIEHIVCHNRADGASDLHRALDVGESIEGEVTDIPVFEVCGGVLWILLYRNNAIEALFSAIRSIDATVYHQQRPGETWLTVVRTEIYITWGSTCELYDIDRAESGRDLVERVTIHVDITRSLRLIVACAGRRVDLLLGYALQKTRVQLSAIVERIRYYVRRLRCASGPTGRALVAETVVGCWSRGTRARVEVEPLVAIRVSCRSTPLVTVVRAGVVLDDPFGSRAGCFGRAAQDTRCAEPSFVVETVFPVSVSLVLSDQHVFTQARYVSYRDDSNA